MVSVAFLPSKETSAFTSVPVLYRYKAIVPVEPTITPLYTPPLPPSCSALASGVVTHVGQVYGAGVVVVGLSSSFLQESRLLTISNVSVNCFIFKKIKGGLNNHQFVAKNIINNPI